MNQHHTEQKQFIADGINKVFEHRKNFIVVGLTGRTGSGCTTAAEILNCSYLGLSLPTVLNPPKSHEDRKLRIVRLWAEEHWKPFLTISVTALILALALRDGVSKFVDLVGTVEPSIDSKSLLDSLEPYEEEIRKAFDVSEEFRNDKYLPSDIDDAVKTFISTSISALKIVKSEASSHGAAYTKLFQMLGNNVRCSGSPLSNKITPDSIFTIPANIERIIKLIRFNLSTTDSRPNYIVIDALRHPYEIRYLRERISSYYTFAVSTTENDRKQRLHALQLTNANVGDLDRTEYPDRIADAKEYLDLVKQNIQGCLELADVYISNIGADNSSRIELTRQLVRYVSLIQHPGLITPTAVERCMQAALTAKANSGCISRQVGAVVTDEHFSVKAMGWNDVPQGQVPCLLRNIAHLKKGNFDTDAYSDYEKSDTKFREIVDSTYAVDPETESYLGRNLSYCFKKAYNQQTDVKNQVHTRSLHAEENAFLQIAKYGGQSISGGYLFTTASPCELCAKKAYQLGISQIFYIDPYPGIATSHVLGTGLKRPKTKLFDGVIGSAYHDLYQPVMSYKDELPSLIPSRKTIQIVPQ
jgi:dCMP deaminase